VTDPTTPRGPGRASALRRLSRDQQVRAALAAGVVIAVAAIFSAGRYPWPFALIAVIWAVATVTRVVQALRAPAPESSDGTTGPGGTASPPDGSAGD